MEVSAKTKDHPQAVTVKKDIPEDLDGLVKAFGKEVIASNARGAIVISLQAFMRRHIEKPHAELQKAVDEWKPDTRTSGPRKSPLDKAKDAVAGLDEAARKELLAQLTGKAK